MKEFFEILEIVLHSTRPTEIEDRNKLELPENIGSLYPYYTETPLPENHLQKIFEGYFDQIKNEFEILTKRESIKPDLRNDFYFLLDDEGIKIQVKPLFKPKRQYHNFINLIKNQIPIFIIQAAQYVEYMGWIARLVQLHDGFLCTYKDPKISCLMRNLINETENWSFEFQIIATLKPSGQFNWKFFMYEEHMYQPKDCISKMLPKDIRIKLYDKFLVLSDVININKNELCNKCQRHLNLLEMNLFQNMLGKMDL